MSRTPRHTLITVTVSLLLLPLAVLHAAEQPRLSPVLQPFVDRHALAGAVILVADKDKIIDVEAAIPTVQPASKSNVALRDND